MIRPARPRHSALPLAVLAALAGCARQEAMCVDSPGPPVSLGSPVSDDDGDGLDDAWETALARAYLPFLATHPDDACPLSGLVFRARPHPDDPALVSIIYSRVFALDCGPNGHVGDNEGFGITVDPATPPPGGLVAMVAVGHQGTPCERTTRCGVCDGLDACERVEGRAVLFASKDKHAGSVSLAWGCGVGSCLDRCGLPVVSADVPLVNAGEPDAPLVHDLTDQGFIREDTGWSPRALLHVDPWTDADFGDAGNIAGDLTDAVFVAPACRCS